MLPIFPLQKKLAIEDKDAIETITNRFEPYSDFNFVSLWSYNTENEITVSRLNENLVVKFTDYLTNEPLYSLIGKTRVTESVTAILNQAKREGIQEQLGMVPEVTVLADKSLTSLFTVSEDRDNFDYILSLELQDELPKKFFDSKKRHIYKFYRDHPECLVREINCTEKEIQEQISRLFTVWATKKKKSQADTAHEEKALQRLLSHASDFQLVTTGMYDGDTLIAFAINEGLNNSYLISHFAKADPSYWGVFDALDQKTAHEGRKKGYTYINYEQDLGIEGLRNAKLAWHPVKFLKKYTISYA